MRWQHPNSFSDINSVLCWSSAQALLASHVRWKPRSHYPEIMTENFHFLLCGWWEWSVIQEFWGHHEFWRSSATSHLAQEFGLRLAWLHYNLNNVLIDCAALVWRMKSAVFSGRREVWLCAALKLQKLSGREAEGGMRSVSGSAVLTQLGINPTRWIRRQRHATVAQNCEINLLLISFHRLLFKAFPSSPLSWGCGGGRWFLAALCL